MHHKIFTLGLRTYVGVAFLCAHYMQCCTSEAVYSVVVIRHL